MSKKILYGILVIVIIIIFTIVWENSQKSRTDNEINNQNIGRELKDQTVPNESAVSISNDINKIEIDSGIDADLNAMDKEIETL